MEILIAKSAGLDAEIQRQLRPLWDAAFDDMSDKDEAHAYVVALDGDMVVAHASRCRARSWSGRCRSRPAMPRRWP